MRKSKNDQAIRSQYQTIKDLALAGYPVGEISNILKERGCGTFSPQIITQYLLMWNIPYQMKIPSAKKYNEENRDEEIDIPMWMLNNLHKYHNVLFDCKGKKPTKKFYNSLEKYNKQQKKLNPNYVPIVIKDVRVLESRDVILYS